MIFGVVYSDKTTEFKPYRNDNPAKPYLFENSAIIDIVQNYLDGVDDKDFVGVFSPKFTQKTSFDKNSVYRTLENSKADVVNFTRWKSHLHFMNWSNAGHKGIIDFIKICCEHVGLKYNNNPKPIIYSNQFAARKYIYVDYVNSVVIPCLELLEGELWDRVNVHSGYNGVGKAKLKELTGLDFYNYIPFILERLPMQYFENKKIKVFTT